MEKLMKPAEYAKELGISRQAVYAKIKRGILSSKNVDGKLYIVVDNMKMDEGVNSNEKRAIKPKSSTVTKTENKDYKALLQAKDETIAVLKGTVKDLKKSNKQISTTLRGEIDLLKEAFYEMRTLYVHQLEQKKNESAIEVFTEESSEKWVGIKKFFKEYQISKKGKQEKIIKRLKKAYKNGDERVVKIEGKFKLNINKTYEDILN